MQLSYSVYYTQLLCYYSSKVGKQESLDQVKVTTSTDEKLMKVTESSEYTATAESVRIHRLYIIRYVLINFQGGEIETRNVPKSTDKISPVVIEETKDKAETKGQAEEPQSQQEKEQQKTLTEAQLQTVEDISITTPEEVNLADHATTVPMILHSMILFLFQVSGDSQPVQSNQVSLIIHYCMTLL